jgi:hypothetical protein
MARQALSPRLDKMLESTDSHDTPTECTKETALHAERGDVERARQALSPQLDDMVGIPAKKTAVL